jgi:hypothetical protein
VAGLTKTGETKQKQNKNEFSNKWPTRAGDQRAGEQSKIKIKLTLNRDPVHYNSYNYINFCLFVC